MYMYIVNHRHIYVSSIAHIYPEMYPGFRIWGSSGPLFEKFGGPLQNFGGPAN